MIIRHWTLGLGAVGLGLVLIFGNTGRTIDAAPSTADAGAVQEGVEAQGRGPVHEAFAEPGLNKPLPTPVVAKKPPEPIEEAPPDQKPEGDNMHWISGYWAYDEDRSDFLWVSGCWRASPPGRVWMPGHWAAVTAGYQWTPGFWSQEEQQNATLLPPPPETIDAGPSAPAPQADNVYVSGCWVYRTSRYVWRPGFWYAPRPGFVWCPARYVWTPGGCIFCEGHWDYTLETRGCLFAPVCIERRFWGRPRWVYRPCCVVYQPALVCSLFVRPSCGCYYFGDYFEPRYRRLGFVAWCDFRIGRSCYDPLFAYCRWQYRGDRVWERNLRNVYINRYDGNYPRPPRTLIQQTTVINNININKTVNVTNNVTNIRNVTMIAPINRVDRTIVKLQPVSRANLAREQQAVQHMRTMARERQQTTAGLIARGQGPTRPTDRPNASRLTLPRVPPALRSGGSRVTLPPTPAGAGARTRPNPRPTPRKDQRPAPRPNPRPDPRGGAGKRPLPSVERGHTQPGPRPTPNPGSRPVNTARPTPRPSGPAPKPATRPAASQHSRPAPVRPASKPAAGGSTRPVTRPAPTSSSRPAPRPARTSTPTKRPTNSDKTNRKQ